MLVYQKVLFPIGDGEEATDALAGCIVARNTEEECKFTLHLQSAPDGAYLTANLWLAIPADLWYIFNVVAILLDSCRQDLAMSSCLWRCIVEIDSMFE